MIGHRIKKVRELFGKNQRDFASSIKIGQSTLAMFENGQREPKEIHIEQICVKYGINKDWLQTGQGEPITKLTRNQEIAAFANDVMELPDKNIKKRLILAISKLTIDDWKRIDEIARDVFADEQKKKGDDSNTQENQTDNE